MDREKLFSHLEQRYTSKRDMISRIPLGMQPDALWQELLNQRRSRSTVLPLYNYKGLPYWYVTTDKMVAASEKIVEALYENEADIDPYTEALPVSTLEEVFYTSYVEGSQISMQAAMDFLTSGQPPRDIEEQMIANNRLAGSYASANLFRAIDTSYLKELAFFLTDGMDQGGQDYRSTDEVDFAFSSGEAITFPQISTIPDRLGELSAFLEMPSTHPLVKAAVAQAYIMILRPFPEGNERLGRLISNMLLLRAGYTFFSEISLSSLIARKSYSYYEAMVNILREENGGDLTYFIGYFLELLSRAIEERQLRAVQKEEQARQLERELAHTPLMPHAPFPPEDKSTVPDTPALMPDTPLPPGQQSFMDVTEPVNDLSGFQQVPFPKAAGNGSGYSDGGTHIERLIKYAKKPEKVIGQLSIFLLTCINDGVMHFTVTELSEKLDVIPRQLSSSIRYMKENGIITLEKNGRQKYYRITVEGRPKTPIPALKKKAKADESVALPPPPDDCDPAIVERLNELTQSNSSKDKRIGTVILQCMPKGMLTYDDYVERGVESKWGVDMQLATQIGLVEKVGTKQYRVLKALKEGSPSLSKAQKRFVTEMYESFGDSIFSSEMVIATLDYSDSHVSAYLHQFTLMRILDCRKDGIFQYQFLVNPQEHPECFDTAA